MGEFDPFVEEGTGLVVTHVIYGELEHNCQIAAHCVIHSASNHVQLLGCSNRCFLKLGGAQIARGNGPEVGVFRGYFRQLHAI